VNVFINPPDAEMTDLRSTKCRLTDLHPNKKRDRNLVAHFDVQFTPPD
jgi:hypothetical protein